MRVEKLQLYLEAKKTCNSKQLRRYRRELRRAFNINRKELIKRAKGVDSVHGLVEAIAEVFIPSPPTRVKMTVKLSQYTPHLWECAFDD